MNDSSGVLSKQYLQLPSVIFWQASGTNLAYQFVSEQSEALLGISTATWLNDSQFWQTHIHKKDLPTVLLAISRGVEEQRPFVVQYRFRTPAGREIWLEDEVMVTSERLLIGQRRDITARKQAEWERENNVQRLHDKLALAAIESRIMEEGLTAVYDKNYSTIILSKLAKLIAETFNATSAYITRVNETNPSLTVLSEYISPAASEAERVSDIGESYILKQSELNFIKSNLTITPIVYQLNKKNTPDYLQRQANLFGAKTIIALPLHFNEQFVGYAEVWETRYFREFTSLELETAQSLAAKTALVLHQINLFQTEKKHRENSEKLMLIASRFIETLSLDEILARTIESISNYVHDLHNCNITSLEKNDRFLLTLSEWSAKPEYSIIKASEGVWLKDTSYSHRVISSGQDMCVHLQPNHSDTEHSQKLYQRGLRTLLYIPLKIRHRVIGILHINIFHEHRVFSPEEISLSRAIANFAAIAISNAQLLMAKRKQLHISQTLQKMGKIVISQLSPLEVYGQLLALLKEVVPYDWASFQILDEHTGRLVTTAGFESIFYKKKLILPQDVTDAVLVRISDPPYWALISDTSTDPRWVENDDMYKPMAWIGAALRVKDKLVGVLSVTSYTPHKFNSALAETVATFANQAANAVQSTRLHDEMRQRVIELSILHQIAELAGKQRDANTLIRETTVAIKKERYPDVFGFALLSPDGDYLIPHRSMTGVTPDFIDQPIPTSISFTGQVVITGEAHMSGNVAHEPHYYPGVPSTVSEIAVPLILEGQVIGAINVESPLPNAFDQHDLNFLKTLAGQITAVMEQNKLYDALRTQAAQLAKMVERRTGELQAERDTTLAILQNAGEGIWLADEGNQIRFVNPAVLSQTGFTDEELLGKEIWHLFGKKAKGELSRFKLAIDRGESWSGELVNEHKNGRCYDISLTLSPIKNNDGKISGYVGVQANISRLKEADRLKSQFITNISHEIKTPITSIKTYLSLLERGKQEKRGRYLFILNQEAERLAKLIQDLLDLSRLETMQPISLYSIANLSQQILGIVSNMQNRNEAHQQTFQISLPEEDLWIGLEPSHLAKLLYQLFENATLYSPPDGTILLSARQDTENKTAVFKIQDEGPGISAEEQEFIFNRFYRGPAAELAGNPGTGLGLTICQTIVNMYSGTIAVESDLDQGAIFIITLPLAPKVAAQL